MRPVVGNVWLRPGDLIVYACQEPVYTVVRVEQTIYPENANSWFRVLTFDPVDMQVRSHRVRSDRTRSIWWRVEP